MALVDSRVSFADVQRMPDDGQRYELYDGGLSVVAAPIPRHQVVVDNLSILLRKYAEVHGGVGLLSPLDIVFSDFDVLQPDLVFFTSARRHLVHWDVAIRHRPDLAIEVLSWSTRSNDRGRKMEMFARYGVPEYWIADPATACLEVYSLRGGAYSRVQIACGDADVRSESLAGLSFPVSLAFEMP